MAVDLTPGNSAASNLTASNLTASIARRVAGGARDRFLGVELSHAFDPRSLLADPVANGVVASYERPDREFALVAVGEAGRTTVVAGGGPADVREDVARLLRAGADAEIDAAELRPRLLGGFAFDGDREPGPPWDGFGHGTLLLPRLLFVRAGETNGVVVAPGVPAAEAAELVARSRGAGAAAAGITIPFAANPARRGPRPLAFERGRHRRRCAVRALREGGAGDLVRTRG